MVHLKDAACDLRTNFTNQELKQYLWDARRMLAGAAKPVPRGGNSPLQGQMALDECGDGSDHNTSGRIAKGRRIAADDDDAGRIRRGNSSFLGQRYR